MSPLAGSRCWSPRSFVNIADKGFSYFVSDLESIVTGFSVSVDLEAVIGLGQACSGEGLRVDKKIAEAELPHSKTWFSLVKRLH
jgi:hypothetical protein